MAKTAFLWRIVHQIHQNVFSADHRRLECFFPSMKLQAAYENYQRIEENQRRKDEANAKQK